MEKARVFSTTDADFATFLLLEGIRFLDAEIHPSNDTVVLLNFADDSSNCRDLEQVYLNSQFKKFRDLNKYVLKKIHAKLREKL